MRVWLRTTEILLEHSSAVLYDLYVCDLRNDIVKVRTIFDYVTTL